MKKYICREAGCKNLIDSPGYCGKHKKEKTNKRKPFENAERSNASLYQSSKWRALVRKHLLAQGFCVCCGSTESLTVDHIIAPRGDHGLFFDSGNLETLCVFCHRWKTNMEIAERKRTI